MLCSLPLGKKKPPHTKPLLHIPLNMRSMWRVTVQSAVEAPEDFLDTISTHYDLNLPNFLRQGNFF